MNPSEWHIEAIFIAADPTALWAHDSPLSKAIDAAMSHAYAEGRADEREDWIEKTLRAMNETGQGEHLGVTK